MTKPSIGDMVYLNFKRGETNVQRPAIVVDVFSDNQTCALSVMLNPMTDGMLGFDADQLNCGVASRFALKGGNDGQWIERGSTK